MTASFFDRIRVVIFGPLARFFYRHRARKRRNRRYPIQWMTPREITFLDLENYEEEGSGFSLNKEMVTDFAQARDRLAASIKRNMYVSFIITSILITDYFSVDLDFVIIGIRIEKFTFFREVLFVFASCISAYTMILQNNLYSIESVILFIINKKFPLELRHSYRNRYLPWDTYSRYIPTNLPYINVQKVNYWIDIIPAFIFLLALILASFTYFLIIFLVLRDVWVNPSVPIWSEVAVLIILVMYVYGILYFASTRLKMPYRNYIRIEEMSVIKEYWPDQFQKKFGSEYQDDIEDELWMQERGYLPKSVGDRNSGC